MEWYTKRVAELSAERSSRQQITLPRKTSELMPIQRASLAGVLPGHWGSDHLRELESYKSWTYHAVHAVAKLYASASLTVSTAPQQITKGFGSSQDSPDEEWKPDRNHPAYKLLNRPNKHVSGLKFRYQMAQQIRLTGGALIWEVKSLLGKPCELWVLPRAWAYPQMPTHEHPLGHYRITPYRNQWTQTFVAPFGLRTFDVDMRETILMGWPDPLQPGECTSPLSASDRLIDTANMTETAVWASMVNGIKPGMAFSIDPKSGVMPTEEQMQQFEQKLVDMKAGPHNAGKILAMIGLGVQMLNMTPVDIAATENREQNRKFVHAIQGTGPTLSGDTEQTAYSAAAVAVNTQLELGVQPDLDLVSSEFTERWQRYWGEEAEEGGEEFRVALDAKRFDDPTLDLQWAEKKQAGYTAMYVTGNEARKALKLPPRPDLDELKKPDPIPGAIPGMPGAEPGGEPQAEEDPLAAFDIEDELADDDGPGFKRPELQGASGNRMPEFSRNGSY